MPVRTKAAILSFLLPGLGQIYVGKIGRAIIWFLGLILVGGIAGTEGAAGWIAPAVGGALAVCSAVDAAIIAPTRLEPRR